MKEIEKEFIEFSIQSGRLYGLDSLSSKLFAITFLEPEEISLDQLSKRTGYSLASISNKMRFLQRFGFVERVKKPGSKKVYYHMEKDVIKFTLMFFERMQNAEFEPAKKIMPRIIKKINTLKLDENEEKKAKIIKEYYKNLLKIDKLMKKFVEDLKGLQ